MTEARERKTRRAPSPEAPAIIGETSPGPTRRSSPAIKLGDRAAGVRLVTGDDLDLAGRLLGDADGAGPLAGSTQEAGALLTTGLVAAVLTSRLPGAGTIILRQDFHFLKAVELGDELTATVTVSGLGLLSQPVPLAGPGLVIDCVCLNQRGETVMAGVAEVQGPGAKRGPGPGPLAAVRFSAHAHLHALLAKVAGLGALSCAVVHPCDAQAMTAVAHAAAAGLIVPILVGPKLKIAKAALEAKVDIGSYRLIDTPHSQAAAAAAVALVRNGEAALLMKGSLHTDELLHAVVDKLSGIRTGRRISHVYVMDVPGHPRPLLLTDCAVNIAPDLEEKRDIVQNAVDLAHALGIPEPKVALLSAVEMVNPKLQSTLDAALLCKMADRGQITGAVLDGPLAFDNAVSAQAAKEKGIVSKVAGVADILVVPNLEAGNMLAKQLTFLGGADAAGVVMGARVPIVLTSRADSESTRLASCAVASLIARRQSPSLVKP